MDISCSTISCCKTLSISLSLFLHLLFPQTQLVNVSVRPLYQFYHHFQSRPLNHIFGETSSFPVKSTPQFTRSLLIRWPIEIFVNVLFSGSLLRDILPTTQNISLAFHGWINTAAPKHYHYVVDNIRDASTIKVTLAGLINIRSIINHQNN